VEHVSSRTKQRLAAKQGWLYRGWRRCGDDLQGTPRYFRCQRCYTLVTRGQVAQGGGCTCGNRRLCAALALTWTEAVLLKLGYYRLSRAEQRVIRPLSPGLGAWLRAGVLGHLG
jgi:hypothetical protein